MSEFERILVDIRNTEDIDRAVAACETLDRTADESWLPQLHELLAEGEDFFVREAAATPIARLEGVRALPQLLNALSRGKADGHDNDGLVSTIVEVVEADPEHVAPMLFEKIGDSSEKRRAYAAWLWGFAAAALTPGPLMAALTDPSPLVRDNVAGSLSSFKGQVGVLEALLSLLGDADEGVRVSAASALGYHGDLTAISALRAALADPAERVRFFAQYALDQLQRCPLDE